MSIKFQITKVAAIFVMATTFMFFTGCKSQQKAITTATPQPTLINEEAKDWAKVHTTELIGKYMAKAGNKIDPDEMRLLFTPIGYDGGSNTIYYRDAERYLVDTLYSVMLERAVKQGKTQFVIFTGVLRQVVRARQPRRWTSRRPDWCMTLPSTLTRNSLPLSRKRSVTG